MRRRVRVVLGVVFVVLAVALTWWLAGAIACDVDSWEHDGATCQ